MIGDISSNVLSPAGPVSATIAEMAWVLIIGATAVFVIVMALLAWALFHRRDAAKPRGSPGLKDKVADRRQRLLWIVGGGLAFPLTVLSALLVYATVRTPGLAPPPRPDELIVTVTGRMWWWEVHYHQPSRGIDVVLANQINLPVGRAVTLGLVSGDVIHSFWVPALGGKVDMVPGRVHQLRVQADKAGVYRGPCAEFCGDQHARMAIHVVAQAPDEFERWLALQQGGAAVPPDDRAQRGLTVFQEQRCNACHTVRGLAAPALPNPAGPLGPDLTHVGSRLYLAAGTLGMAPDAMRQWIAHADSVKPGVRMPSYARLDPASLDALSHFLLGLK